MFPAGRALVAAAPGLRLGSGRHPTYGGTPMPMLKRADAEIHYEVHGRGFPVLLYAPGGLRSNIEFWGPNADGSARAWMDPRAALADQFTIVAMDQRNAGK